MPAPLPWYENKGSLAERHEQLRRASQAMWQLLKSKLDLSDDELHYTLARIEPTTAQQTQHLLDCSVCRHPVQSTAKCCLYCGTVPQIQQNAARLNVTWHTQQ